jgi:Ca-activated chloride channel family protein
VSRYLGQFVAVLLLCLASVVVIDGQAVSQAPAPAFVEGIVTDEQAAPIPGATVRLLQGRNTVASRTTDVNGRYSFDAVRPGEYRLSVTTPGFLITLRDVSVKAGADHVNVPAIKLKAGGVTETVTVSAEALTLQAQIVMSGRMPGMPIISNTPSFNREAYAPIVENAFKRTADSPLSTFSADVDTASYSNVRRFLRTGALPPRDTVRVEEMLNYFRFTYPTPTNGDPLSITTETGPCPWASGHELVLVGLQSKPADLNVERQRNIVLLVDVSGSMASADKLPLLQTGFRLFADTLTARDRIAIVTYAGASGLALPATSGADRERIHGVLVDLEAGGSTNGAQGIRLAYQVAREQFIAGGINRVILATDGDFNVGVTSQGELVRLIEQEREHGIFLSVLGVGTGNLQDSTMELLADKGNGNYAYLDSVLEARRVLVEQGGATLETVAKDVKLQVEFNPRRVAAWKLIGYENRLLEDEDFNDDRKDAGEVGAGHTVTALYEVVPVGAPLPASLGSRSMGGVSPLRYQTTRVETAAAAAAELMAVNVRYKTPTGPESRLIQQAVVRKDDGRYLPFAAAVAELGLLLRQGEDAVGRLAALADRVERMPETTSVASEEDFRKVVRAAARAAVANRR